MVLVAAATALGITACGNGDGIVINGTSAGAVEGEAQESSSETAGQISSGTTIEIVTGETSPAMETAPESTEGQPETTEAPVQTQAPTQAPTSPSTRPAAQPETTAAKVYKVTDLKKTMYATAAVRVRASYSTSSDVLAGLTKDEKVEVTGQSENGWLRVNYKGHTGYVSKDYLTETPPETAKAQTDQTSQGGGTGSGNAGGTSPSNNNSTTTKPAGPTAGGTGTSSGGTTGPGGGSGSTAADQNGVGPGGSASPGGTVSPGGNSSPGGNTSPGGASQTGGSSGQNSVTGSITNIDPTGVTVQTSDGTSYQFTWGGNTPKEVAPGDKIQIFYETTSSGERRVTSYSK